MKIAILQSNYIPWKGYFDIINKVDCFVIYDDVQYTRRDWRNRNLIKSRNGPIWLTIPVKVKGNYFQKISEIEIADPLWGIKHWKTIEYNYKKAPYFEDVSNVFSKLFLDNNEKSLSHINTSFIEKINLWLNIKTRLYRSNQFNLESGKTERLLAICKQLKADKYLSGPSAKSYLDTNMFLNEGIDVEWMDYSDYPEYPQLYPPFLHHVSILDLFFNTGKDCNKYLKS